MRSVVGFIISFVGSFLLFIQHVFSFISVQGLADILLSDRAFLLILMLHILYSVNVIVPYLNQCYASPKYSRKINYFIVFLIQSLLML